MIFLNGLKARYDGQTSRERFTYLLLRLQVQIVCPKSETFSVNNWSHKRMNSIRKLKSSCSTCSAVMPNKDFYLV